MEKLEAVFTEEVLSSLLPRERVEGFFEAFYFGEEPAYDLSLGFAGQRGDTLVFELRLTARPGQCLRCNLTWGLPDVMARHPQLDLDGVARRIGELLPDGYQVASWELGPTEERGADLHVIPFLVRLAQAR